MEINLLLKGYLKRLRMPQMAQSFERYAEEAIKTNLPYERYLLGLVEEEVLKREENALKIRLKRAQFPMLKTLETFDFSVIKGLNNQKILQLAQCDWIDSRENVVLVGNPGVGKTHLGISLGISACRKEKRVKFYTGAGLVNLLLEAQASHELSRIEKQIDRLDLLIIDELGYVPFSKSGGELLFSIFAARYERRSVLITSNLEFSDWGDVFSGDIRMTGALLDRLTHKCHIIKIAGESYRFKNSKEVIEQKDIDLSHSECIIGNKE